MVNFFASWAIVLPSFVVVGSAYTLERSPHASRNVHANRDSLSSTQCKVAAAYWPSWNPDLLPLDKVSWGKYTHLAYAFV